MATFYKWAKRCAALAAVLLVVVWLVLSWVVAHRMTRRVRPMMPEPAPAIAWGTIESLRLATDDGEQIGGWLIDGRADKPGVLVLHGNEADRGSCLGEAQMLAAAGYPVLLITMRANGDSTGEVNDFGYSARRDVAAAIDWWEKKRPGRPIVVWGRSMGAAAAVFAASQLGSRVQGYILECPYQDLPTAIRNRTRLALPPVLEWVAYCGLRCVAPLVLSDTGKISPVDAVSVIPVGVPVLILAGGQDVLARPEEARAIYDRIKSHATLAIFDGAGHFQLQRSDTDRVRYRTTVLSFIEASASGSKMMSAEKPNP